MDQRPETAYRPRRTCLSVPASSAKMIEKAKSLPADEVFLDLEDAVAVDAKAQARSQAAIALSEPGWSGQLRGACASTTGRPPWTYTDVIEVVSTAGVHARRHRAAQGHRRVARSTRAAICADATGNEMLDEASRKMALVIAAKGRAAGMTRQGERFQPPI